MDLPDGWTITDDAQEADATAAITAYSMGGEELARTCRLIKIRKEA